MVTIAEIQNALSVVYNAQSPSSYRQQAQQYLDTLRKSQEAFDLGLELAYKTGGASLELRHYGFLLLTYVLQQQSTEEVAILLNRFKQFVEAVSKTRLDGASGLHLLQEKTALLIVWWDYLLVMTETVEAQWDVKMFYMFIENLYSQSETRDIVLLWQMYMGQDLFETSEDLGCSGYTFPSTQHRKAWAEKWLGYLKDKQWLMRWLLESNSAHTLNMLKVLAAHVDVLSANECVENQLLVRLCSMLNTSASEGILKQVLEVCNGLCCRKFTSAQDRVLLIWPLLEETGGLEYFLEFYRKTALEIPNQPNSFKQLDSDEYSLVKLCIQVVSNLGINQIFFRTNNVLPARFETLCWIMLEFGQHPSHITFQYCLDFWRALFRHPLASHLTKPPKALLIPPLLQRCAEYLARTSENMKSSKDMDYFCEIDFDEVLEAQGQVGKMRMWTFQLIEAISKLMTVDTASWILQAFQVVLSQLENISNTTIVHWTRSLHSVVDMLSHTSTSIKALSSNKNSTPNSLQILDQLMALLEYFVQKTYMDCKLVLVQLEAIKVLFQVLVINDTLLLRILNKCFTMLENLQEWFPDDKDSRRDVRKQIASLFVRLANQHADLLMPHFENLEQAFQALFNTVDLTLVERTHFETFFMELAFQVSDPVAKQNLFQALVRPITSRWHAIQLRKLAEQGLPSFSVFFFSSGNPLTEIQAVQEREQQKGLLYAELFRLHSHLKRANDAGSKATGLWNNEIGYILSVLIPLLRVINALDVSLMGASEEWVKSNQTWILYILREASALKPFPFSCSPPDVYLLLQALFEQASLLQDAQWKIILDDPMTAFIRYCPGESFNQFLAPLVVPLLEFLPARLRERWQALLNKSTENSTSNEQALLNEIEQEKSLREVTRSIATVLQLFIIGDPKEEQKTLLRQFVFLNFDICRTYLEAMQHMLFCKDSLSFERTLNAAIFLLRIPPERDFTPFALVTNTLSNLVRGDEVSYEQSIELTERFLDLIPPCLQALVQGWFPEASTTYGVAFSFIMEMYQYFTKSKNDLLRQKLWLRLKSVYPNLTDEVLMAFDESWTSSSSSSPGIVRTARVKQMRQLFDLDHLFSAQAPTLWMDVGFERKPLKSKKSEQVTEEVSLEGIGWIE